MGGGDDGRSRSDELYSQQIQEQEAEKHRNKLSLYQQQLEILKSAGGQDWIGNDGVNPINNFSNAQKRIRLNLVNTVPAFNIFNLKDKL